MASASRAGSHASRPYAYQLACAKSWPVQFVSLPVLATPAMPVQRVALDRAVDDLGHRATRPLGVGVGVEELLPHRRQVDEVRGLAEVLLRDLQLGHDRRLRHGAEERMERLARLEVEGAVLHLHEDVVAEPAVERHELHVGALDAVGVDVGVVDERAPHHDAAVRRDGVGEHVRAVGVRAAVVLRAGLALAVGLDEEPAEVGDARVDLVRLVAPPVRRRRGRADRRWGGRRAAWGRRSSADR